MHLTYRNAFHFIPSRLSSISRLSSHLEDPISPRASHPIESISVHLVRPRASQLTMYILSQPRASHLIENISSDRCASHPSHPTKYFLSPLILVHVQYLRAFPNPSQTWPHFLFFIKFNYSHPVADMRPIALSLLNVQTRRKNLP